MDIAQWWPKLESTTRKWLVDNNGDTVPPHLIAKISAVGGPTATELPDADVDWIEAVANDESPSKKSGTDK